MITEYDHVSPCFEHVGVANGAIRNYITLLFGMLVTSYLAAHRLDRVVMVIALVIYSIVSMRHGHSEVVISLLFLM